MRSTIHPATACFLSGLLLLGGCRKGEPARQSAVTFTLSEPSTRMVSREGDRAVDTWTLLLYRDGKLTDTGTSASDGPIVRKELDAGVYTAWAVVNPPAGFRPDSYRDLADLEEAESSLADNAPGRLLMAGSLTFSVPLPEDVPQVIRVNRLVCLAGIRKISTAFTDPVLAALSFRLKALYLTNCYGRAHLGRDDAESDMDIGNPLWYNRMGFRSDPAVDALVVDRNLDIAISPSSPCLQAHWFYCYANPTAADSRSGDWSPRHTRLVIEAEIGSRTCYYAVTLPTLQRNKTYLIEEAVIRNMGSGSPEEDIPGIIDVVFRTETLPWNPEYAVQENS